MDNDLCLTYKMLICVKISPLSRPNLEDQMKPAVLWVREWYRWLTTAEGSAVASSITDDVRMVGQVGTGTGLLVVKVANSLLTH